MRNMCSFWRIARLVVLCGMLEGNCALAQSFHRAGTDFNALRSVAVPAEKGYAVVVTEFFHHGEIRPDGRNVVVVAKNRELAPCRVLQLGPGDFCRLAFQTLKGQTEYDIFYGGEPPTEPLPTWSATDGLLLETRRYQHADLNQLDAVRKAFETSQPNGADYVDGVFHAANPVTLQHGPFLSRYTGFLEVAKPGKYGFFTSSQDCSFLLIDDKLVAAAPGRHGPIWQAKPGTRADVQLTAGKHKFEYYHAAAGDRAMMAAVWEIDPPADKPQHPVRIPPEAFHAQAVGHVPAGNVTLRKQKLTPDFTMEIVGDAPLPDNDAPLIGVRFHNTSPRSLTLPGARMQWDFGDGQTSDAADPSHVYLRPGLYDVALSIRRPGTTCEIKNRVYVDRPQAARKDKQYVLDDFLSTIEAYDPKKLAWPALQQLVLALEAKALSLENKAEDAGKATADESDAAKLGKRGGNGGALPQKAQDALAKAKDYWEKAVAAGLAALTHEPEKAENTPPQDDADVLLVARLIGPLARQRLGDADKAMQVWRGALARVFSARAKAECSVAAADIAVNDLLDVAAAKPLLAAAASQLGPNASGPTAAELQRVWGDFDAATGDGKAARTAYLNAAKLVMGKRRFNEQAARRGAHARSTEEFIQQKQYARAAAELMAWQSDFPAEKLDGYLTLLYARYWAGCGKYAQAIAQADRLLVVSPDSPYCDQVLFLAADCEMRRGRKDRALATLHALVKDYPGSPLAPVVKKNIVALKEAAGKP